MIRDNSIGNPFIDSVRNTSGTRKAFNGFSNVVSGRIRNIPSAEYHGHLTGTYMVELNDAGTDQLIPCKLLKASASMDGVGDYTPCEEGDPVTILFKDGRMDIGYILGGTNTEGNYRDFLIEGKGKDPFSLTDTGSKEVEINQPSIHPDRIATPDAQFHIVGSRELGKDAYSDVALSNPLNLIEVASQRPQPGSILIRNKQGDVAQYAKGDIILYADGDIILLSNKTKDAECNKLRNRVQYYKDLLKKLELKFKGSTGSYNPSITEGNNPNYNPSVTQGNNPNYNPSVNNTSKELTTLTDSFTIDPKTQKLGTTKINGLVDLLTSKSITKFPIDDTLQYSILNKNTTLQSVKPKLTDDSYKNAEILKEYGLSLLSTAKNELSIKGVTEALTEALKELDKVPNNSKVSSLKTEIETINKQISINLKDNQAPYESKSDISDNNSGSKDLANQSLPPDHPKNREKYTVDSLLNADYLEPYILRYHIDQLNKLIGITTSEIETCMRELATVQSPNTTNSNSSPLSSNTPFESTTNYNPSKNKCGKTLVETIKDLESIVGKSYGSGTCYEGVADAIDYAGLGKLGGDCQINGPNSVANNLAGYTAWAVDFARFFNDDSSMSKKFNIRNLRNEGIIDPNDPRVPPGAVIVVGQNEFVNRIEGDINIKTDDGRYLNPRSMTSWMTASDYWLANPDKVHGIFVEDVPISVTSNEKKDESCDINLNDIVTKAKGFQGAINVISVSDKTSWNYNGTTSLVSPASAIKLHIALALDKAVQQGSISLDTPLNITDYFAAETYTAGTTITVGQALDAMLSKSSNVTTNLIVDKLGGKSQTTSLFKSVGSFNSTNFVNYLSLTADDYNSGENSSTAAEVSQALYKLITSSSNVSKRAVNALKNNKDNFGLNSILSKDAGNSKVVGSTGLFEQNGKQYIISVFYYGNGSAVLDELTGRHISPNDHFVTNVTNLILNNIKECPNPKGNSIILN